MPRPTPRSRQLLFLPWLALAYLPGVGCASAIPAGSYGVSALEVEGTEKLDDEALKACLATYPRERFGITFGSAPDPQCGVPPFDASRAPVELWAWPWTEWPIWNETAFERDIERVERWYAARGYYSARVVGIGVDRDEEDREVEITLRVDEGEPVVIMRSQVLGIDHLDSAVKEAAEAAVELREGDAFDEALYDRSKRGVLEVLQEASYARATVSGRVTVDPERKLARVEITAVPGPACVFGDVIVQGNGRLPAEPIRAAADIERGVPFSLSGLRDARRAVSGLGPFASVRVEHHLRPDTPVADVLVRVLPARRLRFGVGVGIESGGIYSQEETGEGTGDSFAQWDVHLLGKVEHKNFLGGMRRLRIEDRPRLIFDDPFPSTARGAFGNRLTIELRQPAFLEPRTTLVGRARWDRGPDPYGSRFLRHDVVAGAGPERFFLGGKLLLASSINLDVFFPDENRPYPPTEVAYLYHRARVDLRDDPRNTTRGSYFALGVQHTAKVLPTDWEYLRLTGDARGYVPLPMGMVLAGRVRLGLMEVLSESISRTDPPEECAFDPDTLDAATRATCEESAFLENLAAYGPLRHRLRGGGHNSVRGYEPNRLGDVEIIDGRLLSGGLRQWEASAELRVPITLSFGAAFFVDTGDVARERRYRLDHPQTSVGIGLRYRTIIGPLRFDAALAPSGLQTLGTDERTDPTIGTSSLFGIGDGSLHLTIGEAF